MEPIGVLGQDAKSIARPVISLEVAIDDEVMVRIAAVNDGTGTREVGHYDIDYWSISVRKEAPEEGPQMRHLWAIRIENYKRGSSMVTLMNIALEVLIEAMDRQRSENPHPGFDHVFGGPAPAFVSAIEAREGLLVCPAKVGVAMAMETGQGCGGGEPPRE